jgi:hypothetical protein
MLPQKKNLALSTQEKRVIAGFIAHYIRVSIEGSSANEDKYIGEIKNNMLKTITTHPLSLFVSIYRGTNTTR